MKLSSLIIGLVSILLVTSSSTAQMRISTLCHVKGQEENTLHGIGLVVGLDGTGDSKMTPTSRALARILGLMENPVTVDSFGSPNLREVEAAQSVALVFVTAKVAGVGARQGTLIDCTVSSAFNAKSLRGGTLLLTPMLGPNPVSKEVFATASGSLHLEDESTPTVARIHNGAQLQQDINNAFIQDGKFTLVLNRHQASFSTANEIAELLRTDYRQSSGGYDASKAKAIDQMSIEVMIPERDMEDPVSFISEVLEQRIFQVETAARVVINERSGTIVIGANVEVGHVAVSHQGFAIETGSVATIAVDEQSPTKLKSLVDALNALQARPDEIIEIIKRIESSGRLYGELIVE